MVQDPGREGRRKADPHGSISDTLRVSRGETEGRDEEGLMNRLTKELIPPSIKKTLVSD